MKGPRTGVFRQRRDSERGIAVAAELISMRGIHALARVCEDDGRGTYRDKITTPNWKLDVSAVDGSARPRFCPIACHILTHRGARHVIHPQCYTFARRHKDKPCWS